MLGLILIYFIGKRFYELADEFDKNKWGFAVLGVVGYYLGTFIGGIILGITQVIFDYEIDWDNTLLSSLLVLPFGLLSCYGLYLVLNKKWIKQKNLRVLSIDDIGKDKEV